MGMVLGAARRFSGKGWLAAGLCAALFFCVALPTQPAEAQPPTGRIDAEAIEKKTGVSAIVFEAANGFQLHYPERRLKSNIRLDIDDPTFLTRYLTEQPLAPALDAAAALQVARSLVQQAIQHRHKGELQAAYFLYRFALANLAKSDDFSGVDIVTHNVWALRGAARLREESQPGSSKLVLDLIAADAVALHKLFAADARYAPAAVEQDVSLRRVRIVRRVADLANLPTGFAAQAERALATGDARTIPIGWIAPAAEELANRNLLQVLAADGRVEADSAGMAKVWQLYETLRPRIHEVSNVSELGFILDLAKHNYRRLRSEAVAAGGTFGQSISFFTVSKYLQAFGRDLVTLTWRRGSREQALALVEDVQARATTDWMARAHPNNRLMTRAGMTGSVGEVRPASLEESRALAQRKQTPVLVYFKASTGYFLWVILPDGKIETADLAFDRADLSDIMTAFPYGSEASPVASATRSTTRNGSDAAAAPVDAGKQQQLLAELRRKLLPDALLQKLKPYAKLLIIPDGLVNYVPFAALIDDQGRYLIDAFTLQLSPAITTTLVLEASHSVRKAARERSPFNVIAVPSQQDDRDVQINVRGETRSYTFSPLAGAAEETRRVVATLKGKVSTIIPTQSRTYLPVLHFATHGFYDVESPLSSFLILQRGKLTAEQLYFGRMHIETGLVVMSACQSGLGHAHPDSLLGLRSGFLVAGAQSVMGTLWVISDDATVELMDSFYRAVAGGKPLDEALREAQLALKAKSSFADPYYWAAFQLLGLEQNPL